MSIIAFLSLLFEDTRISHPVSAFEMLKIYISWSFTFIISIIAYFLLTWLEEYYYDPNIKKKLAGIEAEKAVQKLLDSFSARYPGAYIRHGSLFVFNESDESEFSVEVDHLIITARNIFLIETKYKSGTIFANADAADWRVSTQRGEHTMRNALAQCKNTCRVVQKKLALEFPLIPIVAIVGNDVIILDAPGNVATFDSIIPVIDGFEHHQIQQRYQPAELWGKLEKFSRSDPASKMRHIERVEVAQYKRRVTNIVETSSIN